MIYLWRCELLLFNYKIGCTKVSFPFERGRGERKRNFTCVQITQLYVITNNDHPFIRIQRDFLIKILIKKNLNVFFHNKTKCSCCKRGRGNGDYRRVTFDTEPLVCVLRQVNLIIYTDSITEQTIKSDISKLRESGGNNWHITSAFRICFPVK